MNGAQQKKLQREYKKYLTRGKKESFSLLDYLRVFMPEIIYRSTRLEGEKITRNKVSSIF